MSHELRCLRLYFKPCHPKCICPPSPPLRGEGEREARGSFDQLAEGQELDRIAWRDPAHAFADLDEAVGLDHRGEDAGAVARKFLGAKSVRVAAETRAHVFAAVAALLVVEAGADAEAM